MGFVMARRPGGPCRDASGDRVEWRSMAEPPGRAARPAAGSSVAPVVVTTGTPCVRGLGTTIAPRRRATFHQTLLALDEEELLPRRPPVVGAGDDRPVVDQLDAMLVPQLLRRACRLVLHLDLARLARVVRRHGLEIRQCRLGAFLDQLARPRR